MRKNIKKVLMIVAAVLFIIFGLLGLALPFLQGVLFLAIGVVLLSLVSSRIRSWIEVRTRPYPRVNKFVGKMQNWVLRIIGPTD